jgi:dihydrofolate reductase
MNANRPKIALVVAVSRNGVIGRAGGLPWRIPSDLRLFKTITMGKPIIMGRKTWEGLPRKPLPGRENIVITRAPAYTAPGAHVVSTIEAALDKAGSFRPREIAVIGGGQIFRSLFDRADRIYLTEVDIEVEGDTFFPAIDLREWHVLSKEEGPKGPGDSAPFTLTVLDRRT